MTKVNLHICLFVSQILCLNDSLNQDELVLMLTLFHLLCSLKDSSELLPFRLAFVRPLHWKLPLHWKYGGDFMGKDTW